MRLLLAAAIIILVFTLSTAQAGWFGPSNYDECIIDSMKGVQSNIAARLIYRSCQEQFPTKGESSQSIQVPTTIVSRLTGNARVKTGSISGNIYNGSEYWTITSIVISLHANLLDIPIATEKYKIYVKIKPYSNSEFKSSTNWTRGANDSWDIESAYGYKTHQ